MKQVPPEPPSSAPPSKVLVVDDNDVNRYVALVMLKSAGWTVAEAADGSEALNSLARERFDVVLLDISMPGLSGEEVCRQIRSDPSLQELRVIAYTAHAMESERQRLMAIGFDDVLVKPVGREEMIAVVGAPPNRG